MLDNTNKGYQYSLTAQLQKTFTKGFYASGGYTFSDARDVNAGTGSQASINSYAYLGSYNTPVSSYSSNLAQHRVVVNASYRKEYGKFSRPPCRRFSKLLWITFFIHLRTGYEW